MEETGAFIWRLSAPLKDLKRVLGRLIIRTVVSILARLNIGEMRVMKCSYRGIPFAVLLAGALGAQDYPKVDLFFGYSFLRYNSAQTIPAFTANGGLGTLGLNFNKYVGLEA